MLSESAIANKKKMATRKIKFEGASKPNQSESVYGIIGDNPQTIITKISPSHRKEYFIVRRFEATSLTITTRKISDAIKRAALIKDISFPFSS